MRIVKDAVATLSRLRTAHARGISHGAFAPETIFVTSFGETMLRHPGPQSAAMRVAGFRRHPSSLPYRAPEYLLDPRDDDETSDVFSAGVVLLELLAARPLFGGADHLRLGRVKALSPERTQEIERAVTEAQIPDLSAVRRSGGALHRDVVRLVHWCLHRDPSQRPQTLADLTRALGSLPEGAVAGITEVARCVTRIAGDSIAYRQKQLMEPEAPQPQGVDSERGSHQAFTPSEIPTKVRRDRGFPEAEGQTHSKGERSAAPSAGSPEPLETVELDSVFPDSRREHPPAVISIEHHPRESHTSGGWLLAAVALLAAGVAASYVGFKASTSTNSATSNEAPTKQDVSDDPGSDAQNDTDASSDKEVDAAKDARSNPAPVESSPAAVKDAPPARSASPVSAPPSTKPTKVRTPPRAAPAKKSGASEVYRPKGI
jgi:serine/threonine protein kinase